MYKVLLADDEMLDLEGMRAFIPWTELGMEVVAAVNSGFAACEVLDSEPIDILVTDIRMPNMTGLELAAKALELQPDISVVFVSGHQDFHYIKQAMTMNAFGYVLKPMDDRELIDSLTKIREHLIVKMQRERTENAYLELSRTAGTTDSESLPAKESTKNGKLIESVVASIRERLHENVTLRDLAIRFSFSPNYLGLLFKEETGQSFNDYVIGLRMEKAKELLRDTRIKIYEVAEQVGYRYLPYFSRQFRETVGMTPLEYRRKH
ncbi:response regulator [Cohnella sp. GCM10027633]|uniref:response regulator transcription factor n=1 Tax=unclassified Cohnella TaxID=2636738 RepID=UPI0036268927